MKRFLRSKPFLALVALVMIATAIAIPLSGSITHSHAEAATSTPFSTTFTTADCSSPVTVVTLSKGDTVSGTIDYVNINDPGEASQGETLLLQETNGPFTQTIVVDSGTQTLNFTAAANNDSLTACIQGEVDTDQTATISGTVTSATTPTPPPNHQKLFVLLQGFDSTLTADQAAKGIIPSKDSFGEQPKGIAPYLMKTYPGSHLLMFSYKGDDGSGTPLSYKCVDTFTSHASVYSLALAKQLVDYLKGKSHIDVYLISHSFGGVVAYGYLTYLDIHHAVNGIIPGTTDDKLAGVITLDSPLGGVANDFHRGKVELINYYHKDCREFVTQPAPAIDDLFDIYKTGDKLPHGGSNSIPSVLFGADFTNEDIAVRAAMQTIHVLTIGNLLDYIYDPDACTLVLGLHIGSDFRSTQWLTDRGNSSGVYGRDFSDGKPTCQQDIAVNHSVVFSEASVQTTLGQFIDDKPITALPAVG